MTEFTIFNTDWGFFALAATQKGIIKTTLPCPTEQLARNEITRDLPNPVFEPNLQKPAQNRIIAYFHGEKVDFLDLPLDITHLPPFYRKTLTACRSIPHGQTTTYSGLAKLTGSPNAHRAAGTALAKNPIPLLIPCHRIIRSDGKIGPFSAPGGPKTKLKLLTLETPSCHAGLDPASICYRFELMKNCRLRIKCGVTERLRIS